MAENWMADPEPRATCHGDSSPSDRKRRKKRERSERLQKKLSCDKCQLLRRLWEISVLGCGSKHQAASLRTSSCSATGKKLSS